MTIEIDVNDRTPPTPCKTEGCGHPRFHVCLYGKDELFPESLLARYLYLPRSRKSSPFARFGPRSDEHKEALRRSANARWAKHYAANKERDDAIVKRYAQGDIGMKPLAAEFGLKYGNVRMILQRAAKEGRVSINSRANNRKSA